MNWIRKIGILSLVMIIFIANVSSQSLEEDKPRIFEVSWANDFIFGTDHYYSNGLDLKYYTPALAKLPTRYILLPHHKGEHVWYGITLTQHFFTSSIKSDDKSAYDRPFASYLMIGHKKISSNNLKGIKKQSEIQLGLLGRYSGGESIQNGIHEILPANDPIRGWNNQLGPDLAINYQLKIEYGIYRHKNVDLIPHTQLKFGIPYTDLGLGMRFRTGKLNDYFSDLGIRKDKPWQLYFFADVNGKFVAYNATIQGGLFNDHIHVVNNIESWVMELNTGFVFTRKSFGIEFGQVYKSPEVTNGMSHLWGYLTFQFSF